MGEPVPGIRLLYMDPHLDRHAGLDSARETIWKVVYMIKKRRILRRILKATGAGRVVAFFAGLFAAASIVIWLTEPTINSLWDSIWYCFTVVSTVGFGDYSATGLLPRIVTIVLSFYSMFFIAVMTSIITNYIIEEMKRSAKDSASAFLDKLERLPELSKEELEELSAKAKEFANK